MAERVAFLGLGIMGSRMAANLAKAGFELTVWNRTASTAEAWAEQHGGEIAATPAEAARGAGAVITMVVDGPQVRELLLGEDGAAAGAGPGTLCVDMSTIAPADARSIGGELGTRGLAFLDAPVSGSSPKAEDGTLTIMVGGEPSHLERARPLFEAMGELVVPCGPVGQGQGVKLINNAVAAANALTLAEALLAGDAEGLDLDALVQVMGAGSGNSTMLGLKAGPMREHRYDPLFKLDHMLKDVALCLDEADRAGVEFPAAARVREALAAARSLGFGDQDFAAVLEAAERAEGRRLGG
jgi:3-hydroxyisobutyrate dehydrogenase-like beta-hydroxyacid dehydrogenase